MFPRRLSQLIRPEPMKGFGPAHGRDRMAVMGQDVWRYNMRRVVVVDVTDDYAVTQAPMPTECYPVLAEVWVPAWHLPDRVGDLRLVDGYLYDWHERPREEDGPWYVGVVSREALNRPSVTISA